MKDLRTGELLPERVERVGSIVWAADNLTLFYTLEDEEQKRQFQLYRHTLGAPHEQMCWFTKRPTSGSILAQDARGTDSTSFWKLRATRPARSSFLPADDPDGTVDADRPREDSIEYYADHRNGLFFIRTNDTGRNFRLVTAPVGSSGAGKLDGAVPHSPDVMLEEVDLFAAFFVACEREMGYSTCGCARFAGFGAGNDRRREIAFPEPVYSAHPHINRIFDTTKYRYSYQSLVTPSSVYDYDVATGESTLLKQQEVPGGFDRDALRFGAALRHGSRWREDSRLAGVSQRQAQAREESAVCLWIRILRLSAADRLQQQPAEPARSRIRAGLRAYSRRRRSGQAVARCGHV